VTSESIFSRWLPPAMWLWNILTKSFFKVQFWNWYHFKGNTVFFHLKAITQNLKNDQHCTFCQRGSHICKLCVNGFFLALLLRVLCQPLYTYPCFCILSLCSHLYKYIYIYYKGLFHSLNFTSISSSSKINTRNKVKLQKQKSKFTWHIKFILHSLRFRRLYIDFPWHVNIKMSNWSKRFEAWELGL